MLLTFGYMNRKEQPGKESKAKGPANHSYSILAKDEINNMKNRVRTIRMFTSEKEFVALEAKTLYLPTRRHLSQGPDK